MVVIDCFQAFVSIWLLISVWLFLHSIWLRSYFIYEELKIDLFLLLFKLIISVIPLFFFYISIIIMNYYSISFVLDLSPSVKTILNQLVNSFNSFPQIARIQISKYWSAWLLIYILWLILGWLNGKNNKFEFGCNFCNKMSVHFLNKLQALTTSVFDEWFWDI